MDCPGQRRTRGDDVRHGEPPGDDASPTTVVSEGPKSWLPGPEGPGHSGATAPDSHRLPRTNARGGECNRRPSDVHRRQVPRGMVGPVRGVLIVVGCALVIAPTADARPSRLEGVANGCYTAAPLGGRFFFKATGPGTFMLSDTDGKLLVSGDDGSTGRSDAPGPPAEWAPRRQRDGRVLLHSTATGRAVVVRLRRASGCRPYPEAEVGATGRPERAARRGPVAGFVDAHVHVTADLRAGGNVISGTNFDRFGITRALGRDEQAHGPDGSLDVTGTLLRSGSPAGTHDVHGWPTFAGWPTFDTYTHQQIYYRWLERTWLAGERLIVAQTVEDAPLCEIEPLRTHSCDEADTIELQVRRLRALQDYVDAQSGGHGHGWVPGGPTPAAARQGVPAGQLPGALGLRAAG